MTRESPVLRKMGAYGLLAIAVVALGYRLGQEDDPIEQVPDDAALGTPWACHHCGEVQHLTPRQRVRLQQAGSDYTVGGKPRSEHRPGEEGMTSLRALILRCPKCRKIELRKAAVCPSCKAAYPRKAVEARRECPDCGWTSPKKKAKRSRPRRSSGR